MTSKNENKTDHGSFFRWRNSTNTPLVGVINDSTTCVAFTIYSTPDFKEIITETRDIQILSPQEGWFEQNPLEIVEAIYKCCRSTIIQLPSRGYNAKDLCTIGITTQRETTIAWDICTGEPLYNAILWNDTRTEKIVERLIAGVPERNKDYYKEITGLPISSYFSAFKMCWLRENVPAVRTAIKRHVCRMGTMDSWIVFKLTKHALHITDVTNASHTMLMNIGTLNWDAGMLKVFHIDIEMLPDICSSAEIYGHVMEKKSALKDLPISSILGNQQAALVGLMCIKPGQTKCTYGIGCSVVCNTGDDYTISDHGLLTTVAYQLGPKKRAVYALEGSVAVGFHVLQWLRQKVRIVPDGVHSQEFAKQVPNTADVYFVPAFTGLYAPYWRSDARGIICGITQFTTRQHIVRAAYESVCFQTRDILECINRDSGFMMDILHCDGKHSSNDLLMQLQADLGGMTVFRTRLNDARSFGAAICAAQAQGIELCELDSDHRQYDHTQFDSFAPNVPLKDRSLRYAQWKKAVQRSLNWRTKNQPKLTVVSPIRSRNDLSWLAATITASFYLITAVAVLIHATNICNANELFVAAVALQ